MEIIQYSTLQEVLDADPVGAQYAARENGQKKFADQNPDETKFFETTVTAVSQRIAADPTISEKLQTIDHSTVEGKQAMAVLFGVSFEDYKRVEAYQGALSNAANTAAMTDQQLIDLWDELKERVSIKDVDANDFPTTLTRPLLVLYSADWCPPCRMIRPTFAHLVPFFDKADVRYCHDASLQKKLNPRGIPQFVAYFPNGASVQSYVGSTAQDIWNTMNNLIALGQSATGDNQLVCDENSCKIVPKDA